MVYFTCNHCGESLKKGSVEKHYFGPCRRPKFLTCVDCMKDFRGEEYNDHTKCITESEKYSAKGFTSPAPSVKGETKQLSWLELIRYVTKSYQNIPVEQSILLKKLCTHPNVPQKRAKFQNFVKNISQRTHRAVVDQVWDLLETEKCARKEKEAKISNEKSVHENGKVIGTAHKEENGKHGMIKKRNNPQDVNSSDKGQNGVDNVSSEETELDGKKKKKKRDKTHRNVIVSTDDSTLPLKCEVSSAKQSKSKKRRKMEEEHATCDDASVSPLKKKKVDGESQQSIAEELKTKKFKWSKIIVKVLESADNNELSVKRLRKKVISEFSSTGAEVDDTVYAKFTNKLSKIPVVILLKDKAKLKTQK